MTCEIPVENVSSGWSVSTEKSSDKKKLALAQSHSNININETFSKDLLNKIP